MKTQPIIHPNIRIDIRRNKARFHTENSWLDSYHSFSFGPHIDPDNIRHRLLLVSNEDRIKPGTGFMTHPHQNMEIVTWVLDGELEHQDSKGHGGIIYPGLAQRMSAGTGIWHSEKNPSATEDVHLIQMWVLPDQLQTNPGYVQRDFNAQLQKGGLVLIASGRRHPTAISIQQSGARFWVGRLHPGETVDVPDSPFVHLYIAKGGAELEGRGTLYTGDAVRMTSADLLHLTADRATGTEVLIWEME